MPAKAFELSVGVSVGGILTGAVPHFAVSPHLDLAWRLESGFLVQVEDLCNVLPPVSKLGVGVYNQTSGTIGYAWRASAFSLGPSLAVYSIPACGAALCGRVVGLGPGGHAEAVVYFADPLGIAIQANVDWMGGKSRVFSGGAAMMVVAGPVLRWRSL